MKKYKEKSKENSEISDFTKLTRSGISLISLTVTIIVIIILSAAVIITISNINPVEDANKARYESDADNIQDLVTNAVATLTATNAGVVKIEPGSINLTNESAGEINYTVRNAKTKKDVTGKIIFGEGTDTDELLYVGRELPIYKAGDTNWYVDEKGNVILEVGENTYGNGNIKSAVKVSNSPNVYYGEKVLNYKTGNSKIDTEHNVEWQIYYSDSKNIYLIATDYIHYDICPSSANNSIVKMDNDYELSMENVIKDYDGSQSVTDIRLQKLNSSYYKYLSDNSLVSKSENMKAVAYMLDTSKNVWGTFAGKHAEYAIGGPTIEMLLNSYNQKYGKDGINYKAKAASVNGYQISMNGGNNWNTAYSSMLKTSDRLYVINDVNKRADSMWLASTSSGYTSYVMFTAYNGYVGFERYYAYNSHPGFRPIVCLNSDVILEAVEGGYNIVE